MITENDGRFDRLTDRKVPVTEPILRSRSDFFRSLSLPK